MSMTQIWVGEDVAAVTPVQVGPCVITQVKTVANDGYSAVQLAYGQRKVKNINKPQIGHYKKTGVAPTFVREFRLEKDTELKAGDVITAGTFAVGDIVAVTVLLKVKVFRVLLSVIIFMVIPRLTVIKIRKECPVPSVLRARLTFSKACAWVVAWVAIASLRLI